MSPIYFSITAGVLVRNEGDVFRSWEIRSQSKNTGVAREEDKAHHHE